MDNLNDNDKLKVQKVEDKYFTLQFLKVFSHSFYSRNNTSCQTDHV
jgi:hypothetical protein